MTFELGINYWPRHTAMYMWREFDRDEIHDEMAQIAGMGFEVVRIFTLTEDFLPAPHSVDTTMIGRLEQVVRSAKDAGLKVVPTLIVINMSGRMWWPAWMLDASGNPGNLYSDPVILESQILLAEACANALGDDECIRAFDLANEIDDAQKPRSRDDARRWAAALAHAIRRSAPRAQIQIGAHLPSLTTVNNMRVDDLATVADEDIMHAYPLYSSFARSSLDPDLAAFACALTSELAGLGRPALMQEFGLCTAPPGADGHSIVDEFLGAPSRQYLASEEEQRAYYDEVLNRLLRNGAAGAYAWCYADYDAGLFSRAPFTNAIRERTFGIVRADGSEKPAVGVFRRLRTNPQPPRTIPKRALDISADDYYLAPAHHFGRLYAKWLAGQAAGKGAGLAARPA